MGPTQQKTCEVCNRKKKNVKIRESDRNECDECSNIRKNELQRIRKEKEQSSMTTPTSPRHISTLTPSLPFATSCRDSAARMYFGFVDEANVGDAAGNISLRQTFSYNMLL